MNHSKKERIDLNGLKIAEMKNSFDRMLTQEFIIMSCTNERCEFELIADEYQQETYGKCLSEYRDVTHEVLFSLFEDGYIPETHQMNFIFKKFQEADDLKSLSKVMEKWRVIKK